MQAIAAFMRPGLGEILVIALVALLLVGAKRLPEIGKAIGAAVRNFQKSLKGDEAEGPPKGE
jgi:sec-independent protein translocase protein TatA